MQKPALPPLTHLQFLILGSLLEGDRPGRQLRATLSTYGVGRTAAAFYQMMARLERAGLAIGWYEQIVVGDQAVTERRYRITAAGTRLCRDTRAFYQQAAFGPARWSDA